MDFSAIATNVRGARYRRPRRVHIATLVESKALLKSFRFDASDSISTSEVRRSNSSNSHCQRKQQRRERMLLLSLSSLSPFHRCHCRHRFGSLGNGDSNRYRIDSNRRKHHCRRQVLTTTMAICTNIAAIVINFPAIIVLQDMALR